MDAKAKRPKRYRRRIPKEDIGFYGIVLVVVLAGAYCFVTDFVTAVKEQTQDLPEKVMNNPTVQQDMKIFEQVSNVTSDFSNSLLMENEDTFTEWLQLSEGEAEVIRVIKSNLYQVRIEDKILNIRLIGVEAPEDTITADVQIRQKALEAVESRIHEGDILHFETDTVLKDEYSNLWVFAFFENGQMVQEWLLKNGYANFKEESQNQKYQEQLRSVAKK